MLPKREPMVYTRTELVSDAVVHVAGLASALIAAPVLVVLACLWFGDFGTVTATTIYAISLVAMLACSAIYNTVTRPGWGDLLRRLDQSAIYMKIAGTYTPFAVLTGTHAGPFLAGIWGASLTGASMILFGPARWKRPSFVLYLVIGWAGMLFGGPLISGLSPAGLALILVGGTLYSIGLVFLLWERLPHHNTVWHVFVLVATALVYSAILVELSGRAAAA
ncbi:hemolysin III family protein [Amaricoccus sp.]|uniref:PAQR family membrane homeostasis protein TrhA n=1 Tax=Amaricoccus sp. TaxID=1872485 RepID=UPI001D707604|nr:hemolysin III family protein [Amaricoccus sp.]MCB1371350.1 hemolysin III family protein [Paracoccaceae bacterium]MCC0065881.1 hemolysin III family protein [Rhodovulum sp.]HRW14000.1 hemolysin III family protein [Amaricoccus sp.]